MIALKSDSELSIMDRANRIVLGVLADLGAAVAPGVDVAELDAWAEEQTRRAGATPAFKGYQGFPATLCVSINEQVVHGIPRRRRLAEGDLVSIDFGVCLEGLYGDGAETFPVGEVAPEHLALLHGAREALRLGVEQMRPGARLGDVGHAVQAHAEGLGYGVVRDFVGHGIGHKLHEPPNLPNVGEPGTGLRLESGMVLAIEPMINLGGPGVEIGPDGWTVTTLDGTPSAHVERSVAITPQGPWVLGSGARPGLAQVALPEAAGAVVAGASAAGRGRG